MCYKDEVQQKAALKLEQQLENVPQFIKVFFKSKLNLKSKQSHIQYWNNFNQFFSYVLDNDIINKNIINNISEDDIKNLKTSHVNQYLNYCREKGNSDGTLNFKLNSLSSLFSYFKDDEIITKDITKNIKLDKPERKELKFATWEDLQELIDNLENMKNEYDRIRNIAIVNLLMGSGIRIQELVGLDMSDLHLDDEIPNITVKRKGGKTDIVDITQSARMSLEEYLLIRGERVTEENKNILFISERKTRISENTIRDFINTYSDGKLTPHMFRKGLGMMIYNNSGDLHMAAEQLGHGSDLTTSRWYVTTDRNRRSDVMNNIKNKTEI